MNISGAFATPRPPARDLLDVTGDSMATGDLMAIFFGGYLSSIAVRQTTLSLSQVSVRDTTINHR